MKNLAHSASFHSKEKIAPSNSGIKHLAAEFRACPLGHHSPALQRLLRVFRTMPVAGKHAALRVDHARAWKIVAFNGVKGQPLTEVSPEVFTDWDEVEWAVFKLRWQQVFGAPVPGGVG